MTHITADDIRELLARHPRSDATLVRWLDTDEIDVVAAVLLSDISYSNRARPYEIIATASDLRQQGDWDIDHPTDDDYAAFAAQLSEA